MAFNYTKASDSWVFGGTLKECLEPDAYPKERFASFDVFPNRGEIVG
jgi:hypothetical protein